MLASDASVKRMRHLFTWPFTDSAGVGKPSPEMDRPDLPSDLPLNLPLNLPLDLPLGLPVERTLSRFRGRRIAGRPGDEGRAIRIRPRSSGRFRGLRR